MDTQYIPIIGKDVIESLTQGMYEDARFIFREYIQNAADQIDKAVREGLLSSDEGAIHIDIDAEKQMITIEDNATGIAQNQVQPILQNIAQSTKKRGVDKGFRGIGRLGGLAYCKKLIYETSFSGEATKSTLTWDAAKLKDIINNRGEKEDAVSVIKDVTTYTTSPEQSERHYFKVILEGITNNDLLDKRAVKRYLSMVAPLPYGTQFIFKAKIKKELEKENIAVDEYKIYLNTEQLFKGYSTTIKKDEKYAPYDEVIDVVFFKEYANDGQLLYWGWHSVSEKNHSLNKVNYMRGFRLRKANIQVGSENTLLKLHREQRFHFYFFGEIYGVHPTLIPNSRRDYFTENDIYFEFQKKLKDFFHAEIYKLCNDASKWNAYLKKIAKFNETQEEFLQKDEAGLWVDKNEYKEYQSRIEQQKKEVDKARKDVNKIQTEASSNSQNPMNNVFRRNEKSLPEILQNGEHSTSVDTPKKIKYRTQNLTRLSKAEQKFLGKIFSIVRGVLDKKTAEGLIQKIEEELR